MPSTSSVTSFALVVALVTITPGLDTALVLRSALTLGRREAAATVAGINLGVLVWAVAAATGVSALLAASDAAFEVLRLVGATYMVLLGLRFLWRAVAVRPGEHDRELPTRAPTLSASFRSGLLTNLLNPKVGAFYLALLPQFLPADGPHVASGILLGLVHNLENVLWFGLLIVGADTARRALARPQTERWIEGITGSALVGFGARLASSTSH